MASKVAFAKSAQQISTAIATIRAQCKTMNEMYFNRNYNSGASNVIQDSDLTSVEMTAAELSSFITTCQQFEKFLNNEEVTQGDYKVIINKLRTDL